MLAPDSLVLDLIFEAGVEIQPAELVEALGGEEVAASRKLLDPDLQDPRFEMELSPSMPFRRRGERRLMIIDDSVAPMREDPRTDPVVPIDLREEKERLIKMCETGWIRLGRIFALGSWGDAVLVAKTARDLRGICLIPWALDPTVDVEGRKRASRLTQAEFEEKILAYEKRLDELSEEEILADLGGASFARRGDLLVVDVLEADGTWDQRKSLALEQALGAIERFSLIPGAPASKADPEAAAKAAREQEEADKAARAKAEAEAAKAAAEAKAAAGPALETGKIGDRLVLIYPPERFDLDLAAAFGKKDFDTVLGTANLSGELRDQVYQHGAGFLAPLEFFSEVFVDGKPLGRPGFDQGAAAVDGGVRAMEVHYPRFGPVLLVDVPERGRFVCSETETPGDVVALITAEQ
jgi:hypothetical protein